MNLVTYLMKSRGPVNTMRRLPKIVGRFGVSSSRMERALNDYVEITLKYDCTPTLAVTSVLLERHPEIFRRFEGAELAVHGYVHTDYKVLDGPTQAEHMEKSLAAFRNVGLSLAGSVARTSGGTTHPSQWLVTTDWPGQATGLWPGMS